MLEYGCEACANPAFNESVRDQPGEDALQFDSIIVGGGSAGCVLASRLSARPRHSVLLAESGMDTPPGAVPTDILDTFPTAALNPRYKWMKLVVEYLPKSNRPRPMPYEQGRVMGGGSTINFQAANRGAPEDYEEWCELGADGWGWRDVLPYFRKLERDSDFDGDLHGHDGPLPVQRMPRAQWSGFSEAVARSAESLGLPFLADQNGAFADGVFPVALSNRPDRRVSVAMAYLDAAVRARSNLDIRAESHVEEILFEGARAVGVRLRRNGAEEIVRGREIILAAGALHSPALLLRAGIGAAAALGRMGIPVRADLPGVGENLREHPGAPVLAWLPPRARVQIGVRPLQTSMRMSSGMEGGVPGDLYVAVFGRAGWHGVTRRLGMTVVWLNKVHSVGRVSLASPHPKDEPAVELNLCADPRDMERLKAGMRFLGRLYANLALRDLGAEPLPARYSERARRRYAGQPHQCGDDGDTGRSVGWSGAAAALGAGQGDFRRCSVRSRAA